MQRFSDLPRYEQTLLMVRVVQLVAEGDTYKSIEDIAAARETSPHLLWLKICAGEGFNACEPWNGFPGLPEGLLTASGNSSEPEADSLIFELSKQLNFAD